MVIPLTDRRRLHRGANDALDKNLAPDEAVEVVITGPSNQAIVGTSRRAFVYKKGFMAGASFGSELTSWDYRHLVGVQLHTGMLSGAVVLQAPGQTGNRTNTWKFGDDDPYKAPNAIPITKPWQQAEEGVARLRQLIDRAHQPSGGPVEPPVGPDHDPIAVLRQLGELRDAGVLDEEEFQIKKAEILRRI
jgi:hypothetical protein